ncbi:MAG: hypothetical protein ACRDXD_09020 [Acidimicrobiia bacterium]
MVTPHDLVALWLLPTLFMLAGAGVVLSLLGSFHPDRSWSPPWWTSPRLWWLVAAALAVATLVVVPGLLPALVIFLPLAWVKRAPLRPDTWACPACGAASHPEFEACPRCGAIP